MNSKTNYSITTEIKHDPLQVIDVRKIVEACDRDWYNESLSRVNDCVVRLGILHGEFHWHKHDDEDEFFYVIEGKLILDLEGRSVDLTPQQGFMVPKGIVHRTRAPEKVTVLMIEGSGVIPTGD